MGSRITLLLSGKLGYNLLIDLNKCNEIEFVATDKNSLEIIDFCKSNDIRLFIGNPRDGKLSNFINNVESEVLLSINYLFLVENDLIKKFKYPVNFHGSLLPKYRGRTPHVWAIINNEKKTGVTAHYIDSGCDTGDIILQRTVEIDDDDTGSSILEKYVEIYPQIVKELLNLYKTKEIQSTKQDNNNATIYGKRTPNDGKINWEWQKERIRNWIRAQASPYPGAFAHYGDEKVIIDKISFSEIGFDNDVVNGTIIQIKPDLIIKTSNGAIKIEQIRNNNIEFIKSKILS